MFLVVSVLFIILLIYYLLKENYQYWQKRGIPGPKPHFLLGNLGKCAFYKASPWQIFHDIYKQYENEEVVGAYRATTPVLLIRDPDLIKEVTVRSFSHFQDNDFHVYKKDDPLFGRNVFTLKGEEWKTVRGQLTPSFTTGKMKTLFPIIQNSAFEMVQFLRKCREALNGEGYEAKELCTRFTLNNIADVVFGIKGKCFEEKNSQIRQLANEFFSSGSWSVFSFYLLSIFPKISSIFPIRFVSKKVETKLIQLVTETLKYREKNNVVRNDFLHLMHELKKKVEGFTDLDVAAHSAAFFFDGYETSSLVLSFILFELASNPLCQHKLRDEIEELFQDEVTYDRIQSLSYLEAVINETMRFHTPFGLFQKLCTKDFVYTLKNGKSLKFEKGLPVLISICGLHRDEKYFEKADQFIPERFLGSNKEKLNKYAYLPLGEGPRSCIGKNYGFLQIKMGLVYIIYNFELSVNKKTKIPVEYDIHNMLTTPVGGLWLDFKKIK